MWNCDKSIAQIGKSGGVFAFVKGVSKYVHTLTPNEGEHATILSFINVVDKCHPGLNLERQENERGLHTTL